MFKYITNLFIFLFPLSVFPQTGTYTFPVSCFSELHVQPSKANVEYSFDNGTITHITISPTYNASDIKDVKWYLPASEIKQFENYANGLRVVLAKYKEWKSVALQNNISKYEKTIDSLISYRPSYLAGFMLGDKYWRTETAIHPNHFFFVSEKGIRLCILKSNIKGYSIKDSHGLWDDLKIITGSGIESRILPVSYLSFDNEKDIEAFIDVMDISKVKQDIQNKIKESKQLDALFK